ncbi:MAG: ribosomal protein S5-alanine N-acetyltransferase [Pseudomonadales bacterium]
MQSLEFPRLQTPRLVLRFLQVDEAEKILRFRLENREHLGPWEPLRRPEYYTLSYWQLQLQVLRRDYQQGSSLCLTILNIDESEVLGVCNFTNIVRGTFQSCHLGYALAQRHEGKGLMAEALSSACAHVFSEMRLHRIMANYLPKNQRSGRLLTKLGFEKEGKARKYLLINGRWEDHVLTSLLHPDSR